MPDGCDRMIEQHARTGKTHHGADLFSHFRLITMHAAAGAKCFFIHSNAFVRPFSRGVSERLAFTAQRAAFLPVLPAAVQLDHQTDNRLFLLALCLYLRFHSPISSFMSSSTVVIPAMPKVSTRILATLGLRKAGSVGPRWMFFTPRYSSASSTMTAFCSYHDML